MTAKYIGRTLGLMALLFSQKILSVSFVIQRKNHTLKSSFSQSSYSKSGIKFEIFSLELLKRLHARSAQSDRYLDPIAASFSLSFSVRFALFNRLF